MELDVIATRYHVLPSEIRERSISDYQFDQLVANIALTEENKAYEKHLRELRSKTKRRGK